MDNAKHPTFSISYFGTYPVEYAPNKYELLFKSAQFADENGFKALWLPERHFHPFGGFSPNPSVLAGALSRVTQNVHLRAGSVVLPLHHPVRIVEEWSVVDNCSKGRVGMAFASGWHPNDFILTPNDYANRKEDMFASINTVCALWKGETLTFKDANGKKIDVSVHPRPLQKELPIWIAVLGSPESYAKAGEMGAGILTNLIAQDTSQLREGIKIYKEALKNNGFSEEHAKVTVLLHTFVGENKNEAIEIARQPLYNYLSSSMQLFQKTHADQENAANLDRLSDEDKEFVFSRAYARYVKGHALIGDVSSCLPTLTNLSEIGVTEFAAFIDFGVDPDLVFANLKKINELKARFGDQYKNSDSNQDSPMEIKTDEYQRYTWSQSQILCPQVRIDLQGNFDEANFVKALNQVAQRHETLRTVFSGDGTEQIIQSTPLIKFISHALHASKVVHTLEKIDECLFKDRNTPFYLEKGPLLRATIMKVKATLHVVSLTAHPLVCDSDSLVCLVEEIGGQYNALTTGKGPALKELMQYRDYVEANKSRITKHQSQEDDLFWKEMLHGLSISINDLIPYFKAKMNVENQGSERFEIPKELWSSVCKGAVKRKCTPFMLLFSAYALSLHEAYGQEDLVITTPAGNRKAMRDISLVANATYELPIRSKLTSNMDILQNIKNSLSQVFEHYNYSPAKLQTLLTNVGELAPCFGFDMSRFVLPHFANLVVEMELFRQLPSHKILGLSIVEKDTKRYAYWNYHLCFDSEKSIKDRYDRFLECIERITKVEPSGGKR